jgi:hypothetical protein
LGNKLKIDKASVLKKTPLVKNASGGVDLSGE